MSVWMKNTIAILILLTCLFIILSDLYESNIINFALLTIGLFAGYVLAREQQKSNEK